nr:transposase [Geomicrobium sp. JCM 19055]
MDNNCFTKAMRQKLAREQRKLSHRAICSEIPLHMAKNYQKQKRSVARLHEKVVQQRNDFLHNLSPNSSKPRCDCCGIVEDLHTKGMLRNRKLASAIVTPSGQRLSHSSRTKPTGMGKRSLRLIASSHPHRSIRTWPSTSRLKHQRSR